MTCSRAVLFIACRLASVYAEAACHGRVQWDRHTDWLHYTVRAGWGSLLAYLPGSGCPGLPLGQRGRCTSRILSEVVEFSNTKSSLARDSETIWSTTCLSVCLQPSAALPTLSTCAEEINNDRKLLGPPSAVFLSDFPSNALCAFLLYPLRATLPAHLIVVDLIILIILGVHLIKLLTTHFPPASCYSSLPDMISATACSSGRDQPVFRHLPNTSLSAVVCPFESVQTHPCSCQLK
jgi:hypothetical protein